MITLGSQSLQEGSVEAGYTFTGNVAIYADALQKYWPQLLRSIGYAATATVAALVLAYPLAYYIAQKAGRWKNVMLVLVIAPFFTSFLIRTLAWRTILSDTGPVTEHRRRCCTSPTCSRRWAYRQRHAAVVEVRRHRGPDLQLPAVHDPAALRGARPARPPARRGGGRPRTPRRARASATSPGRSRCPGVVAGTLLTFIPAAGDFINSRLLGNTQTVMIGQVIDSQFLRVLDYPLAAALSFILLILILASGHVLRPPGRHRGAGLR